MSMGKDLVGQEREFKAISFKMVMNLNLPKTIYEKVLKGIIMSII